MSTFYKNVFGMKRITKSFNNPIVDWSVVKEASGFLKVK
jgi:hypothetical protein